MALSGPVLVATDLSPAADEALRQGADYARALGTRLLICHVLPDVSTINVLFPQYTAVDSTMVTELRTKTRAALHEWAAAAVGRPIPDEDVFIETGTPESGIRAAIARLHAGIVVVGPGSTAARVAHRASWTVIVARSSPAEGGIIGATDFSDPALPAVETAVSESTRRGARLLLLHAVGFDVTALSLSGDVLATPVVTDTITALQDEAKHRLADSLARFNAIGDTLVTLGPPAASIVDTAATLPASLVVVGTHGRSGLKRWVLGSVAERVMQAAPCSVIVVPLSQHTRSAEAVDP